MSQLENKEIQILQNIAKILCEVKQNFVITNLNAGSGSFGKCLFVEDRQDSYKIKKYAIKAQILIDPHLQIIDNQKLQSCQEEAQILREIKHKNVVKVYEDYQIKNYHFIEMEQCDCSLQKWIESQQGSLIPQKQFIHFANQLLDGVEYIHSLNYVLRDLSLGNILICQDGTLKLCDFGLAKKFKPEMEEQMLLTKGFKGAAFYYPPEILNSKDEFLYSQKGDIWAIGVCLQVIGGTDFSTSYLMTKKINIAPKVDEECNKLIQFILNQDKDKRPSIPMIRQFIYENLILSKQQVEEKKQDKIDYAERYKQIEFDYENVIEIENNCIKSILEYPQNAVNLIKLGEIYLNYYKDLQKSELFFKKALQIQENDIDALLGLAQTENLKIFFQIKDNTEEGQIINILKMCLDKSQNKYWRVKLVASQIYYYQRDFLNSYKYAEECLQLNPQITLARLLKFVSQAYQTFDPQSIKKSTLECENIIKLNNFNNNYLAYYLLASLYRSAQKYEQSIQIYQKCIKYTKNDIKILAYLSMLYNETNQKQLSQYYESQVVLLNQNFTKKLQQMKKYI
ncbi:hypothetical protein ABPG74_001497 [Tetrahymena malaccensis]